MGFLCFGIRGFRVSELSLRLDSFDALIIRGVRGFESSRRSFGSSLSGCVRTSCGCFDFGIRVSYEVSSVLV